MSAEFSQPPVAAPRHVLVLSAISLAAAIGAWTAWRRQAA